MSRGRTAGPQSRLAGPWDIVAGLGVLIVAVNAYY
ncbi:MAG: hypothetical protein ACI9HI_001360, partial [Salinirussus sp.]